MQHRVRLRQKRARAAHAQNRSERGRRAVLKTKRVHWPLADSPAAAPFAACRHALWLSLQAHSGRRTLEPMLLTPRQWLL